MHHVLDHLVGGAHMGHTHLTPDRAWRCRTLSSPVPRPQRGKPSSPFSLNSALDGRSPQQVDDSGVRIAEERRPAAEDRGEHREVDDQQPRIQRPAGLRRRSAGRLW
jgi:hypothetical protein